MKRYDREKSRAEAHKLAGKPNRRRFTSPRSSERETLHSKPKTTQATRPARFGIRRRTSATILLGMPLVQVSDSRDSPASNVP